MTTAAAHSSLSGGQLAAVAAFSVLGMIIGVAHYRGWHRGWMRWLLFDANFFMPFWFGATGVLLAAFELGRRVSVWIVIVFGVPAFITLAIMLLSFVWLPSKLLPGWYLDWRRRRRPPWEVRD